MFSKIAYRDQVTGAPRTEVARVIKVDDNRSRPVVVLKNREGWKYTRPLDLVETIDGKPVA